MYNTKFKFDKNAKRIKIPRRMKIIPDYTFKDFTNLEEVIIPNSVYKIGEGAFMNCKSLKKINFPKKLCVLKDHIFENCTSLEEITIPPSIDNIAPYMFCNCENLKKVNVHDNIEYIYENAFQNCKSLSEFEFPESVIHIRDEAFLGCESIRSIHIPKNVELIGKGAFGLMTSLERITVDNDNKIFSSSGNNTFLVKDRRDIIQYAINSSYKEAYLSVRNYNINDKNSIECSLFILDTIGNYAFAGAKNLEKLCISLHISEIGKNAFVDCDNLKKLKISGSPSIFLRVIDEDEEIPFEDIEFGEGISSLYSNAKYLFKNAKNVKLPNSLEVIYNNTFSEASKLEELKIPSNLKRIDVNNFQKDINIVFDKIGPIKGDNFKVLTSGLDNKKIKTLSLKNGDFYIIINENDIIKTNKDDILSLTNKEYFAKDPNFFTSHIIDLLKVNMSDETKLDSVCHNSDLKKLLIKFRENSIYYNEISNNNFEKAISELLKIENNYDEFMFNTLMFSVKKDKKNIIENLVKNFNTSLYRFSKFVNFEKQNDLNSILHLTDYCNLLEKYKQYDKFFYNIKFYLSLSLKDQELLVKHFNKNLKNLIIKSNVLNSSHDDNLKDFIKMCKALGVFSDNEILRQKITTFITEKLMDKAMTLPLTLHTIHSIFDNINPRDELDYEFIDFFIENYKKLFELEKNHSGIISRIYNEFRDISYTSSSNRGSNRHLKITIDKCLEYFALKQFEGINKNNFELALLLQKYYSENDVLKIAEQIVEESKNAPRNIFTKITFNNKGNPIYDYNPKNDLKEEISDDYSFEWLPKQDYNNLILGKYCNCCAHIAGAGQGIMRASMILDSCQNLVIRNEEGTIISKATIYVNKEEDYAVFNTIETSLSRKNENELTKIYKAFLRGTKAFLETYNKNNIDKPIKTISVGTHGNLIIEYLDNNHTSIDEKEAIDFGNYSLKGSGYIGDWKGRQKLILKI